MKRRHPRSRIEFLKKQPIFAQLGRAALTRVDQLVCDAETDPGRQLSCEGHPSREVLIVIDGNAAITRQGQAAGWLGTGDVVGAERWQGTGSSTVTAISRMRLLAATPREFDAIMREPTIASYLLGNTLRPAADEVVEYLPSSSSVEPAETLALQPR